MTVCPSVAFSMMYILNFLVCMSRTLTVSFKLAMGSSMFQIQSLLSGEKFLCSPEGLRQESEVCLTKQEPCLLSPPPKTHKRKYEINHNVQTIAYHVCFQSSFQWTDRSVFDDTSRVRQHVRADWGRVCSCVLHWSGRSFLQKQQKTSN